MSRPDVTVVMPFAGDPAAARAALVALRQLDVGAGDRLIVADNSGTVPPDAPGVEVVRAAGERSPAHARNAGAASAATQWILFLDADCEPPSDLLERYFDVEPDHDVGALAGEVVPAPGAVALAERYASSRNFLSARAHLAHPYLPRAAAANLLVRRTAFVDVGGFVEGVRAAEDTDFCWRLQRSGWRLELRADAAVAHRYRTTLRALGRQWRAYAAGRAWLHERYPDFTPEPALRRALARRRRRGTSGGAAPAVPRPPERDPRFLAIDGWLAVQELIGFRQSNRIPGAR